MLGHRGVEQQLELVGLLAFERAYVAWQSSRQIGKRIAQREDRKNEAEVVERARGANQNGEPAARFLIVGCFRDRVLHALDRTFVQRANQLFGPDTVVI